jgi:hypothetical protein
MLFVCRECGAFQEIEYLFELGNSIQNRSSFLFFRLGYGIQELQPHEEKGLGGGI